MKHIFEKVKVEDGKIPIYEKYKWFSDIEDFEKQLDLLNDMKYIRDRDGIEALLRNRKIGFPVAIDRWLGTDEYHQ